MFFYADFFSISSLIQAFFYIFLAYLFLSIPFKSRSTLHLGIMNAIMVAVSACYFFAAGLYSPVAAYFRMAGDLTIYYAFIHMNMFIYYFNEERPLRSGRIFLALQYSGAIAAGMFFLLNAIHSEKIYQFAGHFYNFNVDESGRIRGIILAAYASIFFITAGFKIIALQEKKREILSLSLFWALSALASLSPGLVIGRALIKEDTYLFLCNISTMLAFFYMCILFVNYSKDRSSSVSRISGICLVTFLVFLQGFILNFFKDKDDIYDNYHRLLTMLSVETGYRSPDISYILSYRSDKDTITTLYQANSEKPFILDGGYMKEKVLQYHGHQAGGGLRLHREHNNNHYICFMHTDIKNKNEYEAGFSYRSYREYMHPAAMKYIYLLCCVSFSILIPLRFFFSGILINPRRKIAQIRLQEQKRFAENQIQNLAVAAFVIDSSHRVLIWNNACEILTGILARDIIGTTNQWTAFYLEKRPTLADMVLDDSFDDLPLLYEKYSRSAFIPEGWHSEGWYKNIGKFERYMIFDAVPIRSNNGEMLAVIQTLQDVTALKFTEEALRKSEETYRTVFQNTGTATIIIEEDTIISLANSEFEKTSGYTREELEWKRSWTDFVSKDDLERMSWYHNLRRTNPEDVPRNYYFKFISRDGSERIIYLTIAMIKGTTKSIAAMLDVTEQRHAEDEMMHMRHYLQNVIDSMPSMLVGVDTKGRITQWNLQATGSTGISQVDALGRYLSDVLHGLGNHMEMVWKAIDQRRPQKIDRMVEHKNGETHYSEVVVYPLVADGVEGAVIRIDDITTRVRIDEMMVQTEKMISVGGLAAGMAHEINNPLSGILMGVENTLRRVSPDFYKNIQFADASGIDMNKMHQYLVSRGIIGILENIKQMGERAAKIVADMLNFSRRSELYMAPTNIANLLEKTVGLAAHDFDLKKKYDFRHIRIIREFDPDLPDVPCVFTEIEQVILNLLKNAAQAMIEKEFIEETPQIFLRLKKEIDMIRIEVEDNGPGIKDDIRNRIFEPFFTTKSVGVGTGLGLSVSYFIIINNHKGNISVESIPGKGAKFIIHLPIRITEDGNNSNENIDSR